MRMAVNGGVVQVKYTDLNVPSLMAGTGKSELAFETGAAGPFGVCLLPDRIKRDKGVWWMPWQQEAMKDVIPCDKPWGAGNRL